MLGKVNLDVKYGSLLDSLFKWKCIFQMAIQCAKVTMQSAIQIEKQLSNGISICKWKCNPQFSLYNFEYNFEITLITLHLILTRFFDSLFKWKCFFQMAIKCAKQGWTSRLAYRAFARWADAFLGRIADVIYTLFLFGPAMKNWHRPIG